MRFDLPESIAAMRVSGKTQTRRTDGRGFWLAKKPGSMITIVHKGTLLGRATVVRTWRERLINITDHDVQAEGYQSWTYFWFAWHSLYPKAQGTDDVTAIEFKEIRWRDG